MHPGIACQPAKQLTYFLVAASIHSIRQLIEAERRILFKMHGIGEKLLDGLHRQILLGQYNCEAGIEQACSKSTAPPLLGLDRTLALRNLHSSAAIPRVRSSAQGFRRVRPLLSRILWLASQFPGLWKNLRPNDRTPSRAARLKGRPLARPAGRVPDRRSKGPCVRASRDPARHNWLERAGCNRSRRRVSWPLRDEAENNRPTRGRASRLRHSQPFPSQRRADRNGWRHLARLSRHSRK